MSWVQTPEISGISGIIWKLQKLVDLFEKLYVVCVYSFKGWRSTVVSIELLLNFGSMKKLYEVVYPYRI